VTTMNLRVETSVCYQFKNLFVTGQISDVKASSL
jgi:hypothetical protein